MSMSSINTSKEMSMSKIYSENRLTSMSSKRQKIIIGENGYVIYHRLHQCMYHQSLSWKWAFIWPHHQAAKNNVNIVWHLKYFRKYFVNVIFGENISSLIVIIISLIIITSLYIIEKWNNVSAKHHIGYVEIMMSQCHIIENDNTCISKMSSSSPKCQRHIVIIGISHQCLRRRTRTK